MAAITTYAQLEDFGRTRLSQHFFMRDFLHSEIAAWYGLRNLPDDPQRAIYAGSRLCAELLEPLQATFGRIHVRSGYRSPVVNALGNRNQHNCASNESNYAAHIWDYPDANGHHGATACIVIPWLLDHIERGGHWSDMAWWIHDHLPYANLTFFNQLAAFNIRWHEAPVRRVDSYAAPKGCLIRPGTPGSPGMHAEHYQGFPPLRQPTAARTGAVPRPASSVAAPANHAAGAAAPIAPSPPPETARTAITRPETPAAPLASHTLPPAVRDSGKVYYRAIHAQNAWRAVNNHKSLDNAVFGDMGAQALLANKGRLRERNAIHGDAHYVLVWQSGASHGLVLGQPVRADGPIRMVQVPVAHLQGFDAAGHASATALESLLHGA